MTSGVERTVATIGACTVQTMPVGEDSAATKAAVGTAQPHTARPRTARTLLATLESLRLNTTGERPLLESDSLRLGNTHPPTPFPTPHPLSLDPTHPATH